MKFFILVNLGMFLVTASAFVAEHQGEPKATECTHSPSFWCTNFSNARECGAMKHCIQSVWAKYILPVDIEYNCKICLDMFHHARIQLNSNGSLEANLRRTCKLLRSDTARQKCVELNDKFLHELFEALSSRLKLQVVCSVAGLCNNPAIDKGLGNFPTEEMFNQMKQKRLTDDSSQLDYGSHENDLEDMETASSSYIYNRNMCGKKSGVACLNATAFKSCVDHWVDPNSPTIMCENGLECSDEYAVCVPPEPSSFVAPICGTCDINLRFGCINSRKYGFCFGSREISLIQLVNCPDGYFCDLNATAPAFCSMNEENVCRSTPTKVCEAFAAPGRYQSELFKDCTGYLLCEWNKVLENRQLVGVHLPCPDTNKFDKMLGECVEVDVFTCA